MHGIRNVPTYKIKIEDAKIKQAKQIKYWRSDLIEDWMCDGEIRITHWDNERLLLKVKQIIIKLLRAMTNF